MVYKCPNCGTPLKREWKKVPRGGLQLYEYWKVEVLRCVLCDFEKETGRQEKGP